MIFTLAPLNLGDLIARCEAQIATYNWSRKFKCLCQVKTRPVCMSCTLREPARLSNLTCLFLQSDLLAEIEREMRAKEVSPLPSVNMSTESVTPQRPTPSPLQVEEDKEHTTPQTRPTACNSSSSAYELDSNYYALSDGENNEEQERNGQNKPVRPPRPRKRERMLKKQAETPSNDSTKTERQHSIENGLLRIKVDFQNQLHSLQKKFGSSEKSSKMNTVKRPSKRPPPLPSTKPRQIRKAKALSVFDDSQIKEPASSTAMTQSVCVRKNESEECGLKRKEPTQSIEEHCHTAHRSKFYSGG